MIIDLRKTPFPWYGGKADAAPAVWAALGDVHHYVEPFAGSLAALLRRPHEPNRTYYSETVNDADGLLCNAWRAMQFDPDATAESASWPVCEADVMARQLACLAWAKAGNLERLMADPAYYDATIAGYWIYGICAWIGSGWCAGTGPWIVGDDGRVVKQPKSGGVNRKRPHLGDDGQGAHRPQLREAGVNRQLPHLGNDGQGAHHAGTREPGGVNRQLPHLGNDGQGAHRPQLREPGVATAQELEEVPYHPIVMPELRRWFAYLSARLRHVRIVNGDWKRVCTPGAMLTLPVRQGKGIAGVFLDPPYAAATGRAMGLYSEDSATVADDVRQWCLDNGANPKVRIVLAGYETEHQELEAHGWRVVEWFADGWLKGGMANQSDDGHAQHRERLWCSPHCLVPDALPVTASMFAHLEAL
jgi:hypothetical protein